MELDASWLWPETSNTISIFSAYFWFPPRHISDQLRGLQGSAYGRQLIPPPSTQAPHHLRRSQVLTLRVLTHFIKKGFSWPLMVVISRPHFICWIRFVSWLKVTLSWVINVAFKYERSNSWLVQSGTNLTSHGYWNLKDFSNFFECASFRMIWTVWLTL